MGSAIQPEAHLQPKEKKNGRRLAKSSRLMCTFPHFMAQKPSGLGLHHSRRCAAAAHENTIAIAAAAAATPSSPQAATAGGNPATSLTSPLPPHAMLT